MTTEKNAIASPVMHALFEAAEMIAGHGWNGRFFTHDFWSYLDNLEKLETACMHFFHHEDESMRVFLWRLQYTTLEAFYGFPIPMLLKNAPFPAEVWDELQSVAAKVEHKIPFEDELHFDFLDTWVLESYRLPGICEVSPGDVVLSCGAFTGNTSLYFAEKVGKRGHVFAFEAVPSTYEKLRRNTAQYANCSPILSAVTSKPGTVHVTREDTAARIAADGVEVKAVSLDHFVAEYALEKVDFIKMDIEGSELDAIAGARATIRRFRPKMAISVYHKPSDLYDIPELIREIFPDYTFRLRHFSCRSWETIMFCTPGEGARKWQGEIAPLSLDESRGFLRFLSFVNAHHQ